MNGTIFILLLISTLQPLYGQMTIVPTPRTATVGKGSFSITPNTEIRYSKQCKTSADLLGSRLKLGVKAGKQAAGTIFLTIDDNAKDLGKEGYSMVVNTDGILIRGATETGVFYGTQTLLQLLPPEVLASKPAKMDCSVPCCTIEDSPKYPFRSFMLDSGRQYQTVDFIKNYLNVMALYKMNVFHWHLTEGAGWRLEIKKYPKLTSIGSNVATGKEQKGYYTQDEVKEIVAYAAARQITVVPEIDVPGHSTAALIAYPEHCCAKKAPAVRGISPHIFCGGREATYEFLEGVLEEVCELFPSPYIHLGGDEAPKGEWKKCPDCQAKIKELKLKNEHDLQVVMMNRLAAFLKTKGRKTICWDDIIADPKSTKVSKDIVIHWWNYRARKRKCLNLAVQQGLEVICNTNYYTYLNFPLTPWNNYKKNRTFDLKKMYMENPSDLKTMTEKEKELVIGMGACLWCDAGVLQRMVDQRVFPRLLGLAQQMWHSDRRIPFNTIYPKIKAQYPRLKAMGIDYGPALIEDVPKGYSWE
jgi:N-acetyl-beta-hexosaminidase